MIKKEFKGGINDQIFYALKVSQLSRVPFLFMSAPGMGKTTTIKIFADLNGYKLINLSGNHSSVDDIMGFDVFNEKLNDKSTTHLRPEWLDKIYDEIQSGEKCLIFLDEITTAPEHIQSAFLKLVFERVVGNDLLPENVMIVAAGNYALSLGRAFTLLPPLMNRFCIYNILPESSSYIKSFLSKYSGASLGSGKQDLCGELAELNNYYSELASSMNLPEDHCLKAGEYIEKAILTTFQRLSDHEKKIDVKVSDYLATYSGVQNGSALCGFISPRTLCFLRDITMTIYTTFGSPALTNKMYRKIVEGLCGVGLSMDHDGNTTYNETTEDFHKAILQSLSSIEKLGNDQVKEYETFFKTMTKFNVDETKYPLSDSYLSDKEIIALTNKLNEMKKDNSLSNLSKPIEDQLVVWMSLLLSQTSSKVSKLSVKSGVKPIEELTSDKIMSMVTQWNMVADLFITLRSFATEGNFSYDDSTKDTINKVREYLYKDSIKISGFVKGFKRNNPLYSALPELHVV